MTRAHRRLAATAALTLLAAPLLACSAPPDSEPVGKTDEAFGVIGGSNPILTCMARSCTTEVPMGSGLWGNAISGYGTGVAGVSSAGETWAWDMIIAGCKQPAELSIPTGGWLTPTANLWVTTCPTSVTTKVAPPPGITWDQLTFSCDACVGLAASGYVNLAWNFVLNPIVVPGGGCKNMGCTTN